MFIYLWTRMGRITSSGVSEVQPGEADISKIRQGVLTCIKIEVEGKAFTYSRNPADKAQPWKAIQEIAPLYVHNVPGETTKKAAAPAQKAPAKAKAPAKGKTPVKKSETPAKPKPNPLAGSLENPVLGEETPKDPEEQEPEPEEEKEEEDEEEEEKESFDWAPEKA
jgi:hypothetical protein